MSFREDGYAAVDWASRYLERIDELPVLAQVTPGELSAKLPLSPPEHGEPFAKLLGDLDELIVPALTNWQHPRFFAYFAVTAAEPGILAELLAATMNQVAILWRASPASTELELRVVDWVRQLLGLPDGWHGHIEDTASTSTLAALIAARHVTGRNVVVCSEHAHSSVDKGARMLGMELRKIPVDDELGMRTDVALDDVAAVVATVGTTSFASVDPVRALREPPDRIDRRERGRADGRDDRGDVVEWSVRAHSLLAVGLDLPQLEAEHPRRLLDRRVGVLGADDGVPPRHVSRRDERRERRR